MAKKRIQVALNEEVIASIKRISFVMGKPVSKVVSNLLEEQADVLDQIAGLLEESHKLKGKASDILKAELKNRTSNVKDLGDKAQLELSGLMQEVDDAVEEAAT
jgi:hypothetical protein